MLTEPCIDKLLEVVDCKYALVTGTCKRVKSIINKEMQEGTEDTTHHSYITDVANEILKGDTVISVPKENPKK